MTIFVFHEQQILLRSYNYFLKQKVSQSDYFQIIMSSVLESGNCGLLTVASRFRLAENKVNVSGHMAKFILNDL